MISISDNLNEYLNKTTRLDGQYVRAEITTKTGVKYSISDDELSGGTVKLNKKSVGGSSFDIGECYINNVTITVIDKTNKFSDNFNNAEMSLFFGVKNDSLGLDEEIQIGKFIIPTDTTIRKTASIQLTGDSMLSKLDLPTNGVTTSGTPYALASWCCGVCGVELALTEAELNALSENTEYTFFVSEGSSISTYRDVVMYVSQIIGGFATDTNDGRLTFKTYSASNSVFNINNDTVASSKLGDSSYTLGGMSSSFNDKVVYIHGDIDSEYVLDLESNPLFDNLTEDLVVILCNNIWSQLDGVSFRSFDFQYNGNPAIECGDILSNTVRGVSSFITSLSWVYHGKSSVVSEVLDKRTKTQSQSVKKAASTGGGGGGSNELSIVKYINTEKFKLSTLESKVAQIYFTLPANITPLLSFVMITKNELAGLVSLRIIYDNVKVLLKPKFQNALGYHTLSFTKSLDPAEVDMLHSLAVYATFVEDSGQQIESIIPCSVNAYDIEANIMGWRASIGKPDWTGRYELMDEVSPITFDNVINVLGFTEQASAGWSERFGPCEVTDEVRPVTFDNVINVLGFTSNINVTTGVPQPVLVVDLLATEATISGSTVLRNNSNVPGGKDLDYLGEYPTDVASWTISPTTDFSKVEISITASSDSDTRSICLYLDDIEIVNDLVITSGSWTTPTTVVAKTINMTAGSHKLTVSRGSTDVNAPLVASINIKG